MKKIILIRHAVAEDFALEGGDFARALTAKGVRRALAVGVFLAEKGYIPDVVIASPALRTRETANGVCAAFTPAPDIIYEKSLYLGGAEAYLSAIELAPKPAQSVAIIGHNPDITECLERLIGRERFKQPLFRKQTGEMPKAGTAVLQNLNPSGAVTPGGFAVLDSYKPGGRI